MVKFVAMKASLAHSTVKERLDNAKPHLDALKASYAKSDAQLVTLRDKVYVVSQEYGVASKKKVVPLRMGVHPRNRGSVGLVAPECHRKLKRFALHGFSGSEVDRAVSVKRPASLRGKVWEKFNIDLAIKSNGQLPDVLPDSLESFSLTCSHTYGALRCGAAAVASDDENLSLNGHISMSKISELCPELSTAIEEGITVLEFCAEFNDAYPELVELIIEADNVPMQTASADTSASLFLKAYSPAKDGDSWATVLLKMQRTAPHGVDVQPFVNFTEAWMGTIDDPWVLKDFADYCGTLKNPRELPPSTVQMLVDMDLGPLVGAHWRGSCLKVIAGALPKYMIGHDNTVISQRDIHSMTSSCRERVVQADVHMKDAHCIMNDVTAKVISKECIRSIQNAYHSMCLQIVGYVLGKQVDVVGTTITSFAESALTFYEFVQGAVGDGVPIPEMPKALVNFKAKAAKAAAKSAAKGTPSGDAPKRSFVDIALEGADINAITNAFSERGAKIGVRVGPKSERGSAANEAVLIIKSITADVVKLSSPDLPTRTVKTVDFFQNYQVLNAKKQCVDVPAVV